MKIIKNRGPYKVEYICTLKSCGKPIKRYNIIKPAYEGLLKNKHFCNMTCYNLFRKSTRYVVPRKVKIVSFYHRLQKKTDAFERYLARQNILDIK